MSKSKHKKDPRDRQADSVDPQEAAENGILSRRDQSRVNRSRKFRRGKPQYDPYDNHSLSSGG